MSDYEILRVENIARNEAFLGTLGIGEIEKVAIISKPRKRKADSIPILLMPLMPLLN